MKKLFIIFSILLISSTNYINNKILTTIKSGHDVIKYQEPIPHYKIILKDKLMNIGISSKEIGINVKGYHDIINIFILLDNNCNITKLSILESKEDPKYSAGIETEEYLKKFKGMNEKSGFFPGIDIDEVSGATISLLALCKSVKLSLIKIKPYYPDIYKYKKQGILKSLGLKISKVLGIKKKPAPDNGDLSTSNLEPKWPVSSINKNKINELIKKGNLSDKEAEYYIKRED